MYSDTMYNTDIYLLAILYLTSSYSHCEYCVNYFLRNQRTRRRPTGHCDAPNCDLLFHISTNNSEKTTTTTILSCFFPLLHDKYLKINTLCSNSIWCPPAFINVLWIFLEFKFCLLWQRSWPLHSLNHNIIFTYCTYVRLCIRLLQNSNVCFL